MPLIALGALSLAVTGPVLSAATIHAAPPVQYAMVTVRPGDNIWMLASAHAGTDGDVQAAVDQIVATNHLGSTGLTPGQRIRIPR